MAKKSQILGDAFEKRIERGADALPVWVKIPNARTIAGRPAGRVWLDYWGVAPGGQAITADAKWVGERTTVPMSTLSKAQQGWIEQAYQAGALCALLVGAVLNGRPEVCVVPWETLRGQSSALLLPCEDWTREILEVPCLRA